MNEEMQMILELTKENARLKAAMALVKANYESGKKDGLGKNEEVYLKVAGMLDKEVNAIYFDNDRTEVAYES